MTNDEIKQLLDKYLEGKTTLEEEQKLREFFAQEDIPEELSPYAGQFRYFEMMGSESTSSGFDPLAKVEAKESSLEEKKHQQRGVFEERKKWAGWPLRIAAGFILLLIGFSAGQFLNQGNEDSQEIAALQHEVRQMREVLMYGGIYQQASAGERLSAVNTSTQISANKKLGQEITEILIHTMNNDKSVNVRMAAAEALFKFHGEPRIQKALVKSLTEQDDPLMQITLINMLVDLKAKGAVNEMNKLLMDSETRKIVRQRLEAGIAELKA